MHKKKNGWKDHNNNDSTSTTQDTHNSPFSIDYTNLWSVELDVLLLNVLIISFSTVLRLKSKKWMGLKECFHSSDRPYLQPRNKSVWMFCLLKFERFEDEDVCVLMELVFRLGRHISLLSLGAAAFGTWRLQ